MHMKQQPNNSHRKPLILYYCIALLIVLILNATVFPLLMSPQVKEVDYSEFLQMMNDKQVKEVEIQSDQILFSDTSEDTQYYKTGRMDDPQLIDRLQASGATFGSEIVPQQSGLSAFLTEFLLPMIFFVLIGQFFFKRMFKGGGAGLSNAMSFGTSNAKVYVPSETGIKFADVAGEEEAKEALQEIVDFLHDPSKYQDIGAQMPKGALLVGPPGTGKTLLAKAVAGEADVPFFSIAGSEFVEMFVGMGASKVRDLFKQANEKAPCIVFIDEIDTIGKKREGSGAIGGNDEREQTVNQLLTEMDGFDGSKGVVILAATNRPEILDPALLRPGRFDRRIIVDRPDLKGRVAILKVHAKAVKMDETVDLEEIALATSGAVGSDLANMINEAAINAVKDHRQYVCQKDLFEAVEQVLVGKEKKDRIMSKEERRIVSYHEVGHALISAVQKNSEPVQKITIVPRTMGALGYVMQVPEEEKYLNSKAELEAIIIGLLGGRAAEELKFESVTTGASNDIERATALARNMVTQYGMSERFGLMGLATVESKYLEGRAVLNCSDVTAAAVDEEVRRILETSYAEAKRILSENMDAMDVIAEFLIRQETITGKEFMQMFNEVREKRNGGQAAVETELQTEKEAVEDAEEPEAVQTVEGSVSGEAAKAPVSVQTAAAADEMSAKKEEPIAAEEPVKEEPAAVEDSVKEREPAVVEDSVNDEEPAAVEDSVNDEDSAPEEVSADDAGVHDDRQEELDEAEEPRRRNTASKGRYSQVSLDDIFGEKK